MEAFFNLRPDAMRGEITVALVSDGKRVDVDTYNAIHEGKDVAMDLVGHIQSGTRSDFDAASCDSVTPMLFSEKFFSVLESIKATGWKKRPIKLITAKAETIEGFSFLMVTGRSGPIQMNKSV